MPYREEKPLGDLIPPDRRRQKTIALVVVGMVMGACVLYAIQQATKDAPTITSTAPPASTAFSATLTGPDGTFTIPLRYKKTVVHVWLQACADCMPAFEAMKKLDVDFGPNVINVAYGNADPSWAAQYGVRRNLVFDHGGVHVVKPLGITSFTSIVFDENGRELGRDRPDRPGYGERMQKLLTGGPLTAHDVEDVARSKHGEIRRACWQTRPTMQSADVTVSAVIGFDGQVISTTSAGTDKSLADCLENQVRGWRFRATGGASTTVDIPFKLRRDE
jgi:hypothetical protein